MSWDTVRGEVRPARRRRAEPEPRARIVDAVAALDEITVARSDRGSLRTARAHARRRRKETRDDRPTRSIQPELAFAFLPHQRPPAASRAPAA